MKIFFTQIGVFISSLCLSQATFQKTIGSAGVENALSAVHTHNNNFLCRFTATWVKER